MAPEDTETERLILRAAQMISMGVPMEDVVETFVRDGHGVGQAHLAARAGEMFARVREYEPNQSPTVVSVALMKFIARVAARHGVADHVYVVGGAVRNFILGEPIKDIDLVIDSVAAGQGSDWFARQVAREIPTNTNLTTNQYGVAILSIRGEWKLDGHDMAGQVIEIANARAESYAKGGAGKGYKPTEVRPATIKEDVMRREFSFNTLLWRMSDLLNGPEFAKVIDLTGRGLHDLEKHQIQTPSDPDVTFRDDPTRMLRAIKFLVKYDFGLPESVAASIRRNARAMADMPWEALGTIFVNNIVREQNAYRGLVIMEDLGLLQALVEIANSTPPFLSYLSGQLRDEHRIDIIMGLLKAGFRLNVPLAKLSEEERERLLKIGPSLGPNAQSMLLGALAKPPVDSMAIINALNIEPRARGRITTLARALLVQHPELAQDPDALTEAVMGAW